MSNQAPRKTRKWKFSLRHLLTLTALAALCIAVAIAYRKNAALSQSRTELLALSSQLDVTEEDKLTSAALPKIADDFETWEIYVPPGPVFELRLGIGEISRFGIPAQFDRVALPAGRHRITLNDVVSNTNGNRFIVYLDGKQAIDKKPPPDWLRRGWSQSSGLSWPRELTTKKQPVVQLAGQSYTPRLDLGKNGYFNGPTEKFVTNPGFRLWIDQPGRTYQPASPFVKFERYETYPGIGLRDGLRYKKDAANSYHLTFVRPKSRVRKPVLRIIPEFIVDGKTVLSAQDPRFSEWKLRNAADGDDIPFQWTGGSQQTARNAFLVATCDTEGTFTPVIELKWDVDKPDEVALRLAKTLANELITGLRLKITDGSQHLWRIIATSEQRFESTKEPAKKQTDSSGKTILFDPAKDTSGDIEFDWQTDETLPLQVIQRKRGKKNLYKGLTLYQGLSLKFAARVPKSLEPSVSVTRVDQDPNVADQPFPGGAVFDEFQIDLKTGSDDWIWLRAEDLEITP